MRREHGGPLDQQAGGRSSGGGGAPAHERRQHGAPRHTHRRRAGALPRLWHERRHIRALIGNLVGLLRRIPEASVAPGPPPALSTFAACACMIAADVPSIG